MYEDVLSKELLSTTMLYVRSVLLWGRNHYEIDGYILHFYEYRKVASSNTSRLEPHAGYFRFLMKGIFDPYVLWPFDKKVDLLITNAC